LSSTTNLGWGRRHFSRRRGNLGWGRRHLLRRRNNLGWIGGIFHVDMKISAGAAARGVR